eukprot:1160064-Pelagomonas_calceolata.AAC.5
MSQSKVHLSIHSARQQQPPENASLHWLPCKAGQSCDADVAKFFNPTIQVLKPVGEEPQGGGVLPSCLSQYSQSCTSTHRLLTGFQRHTTATRSQLQGATAARHTGRLGTPSHSKLACRAYLERNMDIRASAFKQSQRLVLPPGYKGFVTTAGAPSSSIQGCTDDACQRSLKLHHISRAKFSVVNLDHIRSRSKLSLAHPHTKAASVKQTYRVLEACVPEERLLGINKQTSSPKWRGPPRSNAGEHWRCNLLLNNCLE